MKTREERKQSVRWWIIALALYFGTAGSAWALGQHREKQMNEQIDAARLAEHIAVGQRDNAVVKAAQYQRQYEDALLEIAELKSENEELTRRAEEVSFALDEVCEETSWKSLGEFRITHFCDCVKCCGKWSGGPTASGVMPEAGRTVAVDAGVIPLGSYVRINGHEYIAEDTGVSGHAIDIYVNDHQEALNLGMYYAEVEVMR